MTFCNTSILNILSTLNTVNIKHFIVMALLVGGVHGAVPSDAKSQDHLARNRLTVGVSAGIVSQRDHAIPSAQVGYARAFSKSFEAFGHIRFSRLQSLGNETPLQRARRTYLELGVGGRAYPLQAGRHRVGIGLGAAVRGRWEYVSIQAYRRPDSPLRVDYENRRSADVGWIFDIGYDLRFRDSFRSGLFVSGQTFNEGPSIFSIGARFELPV